MKSRIKITCLAVLTALLLSGCASDNTVSVEKYNELKAQYEELNGQYEELKTQNNELNKQYSELEVKNESSEKDNAELKKELESEKNKTQPAEYAPVTLHKSRFTLQYLGIERGENGECIVVMRCQGFYTYPYIRIDTKDFDLHHGVFVVEGKYEFANENIDEDGYLYLINSSGMADSYAEDFPDMKLSFVPEKYIKLRAAAPDTLMYDDADGPTSFIGYLNVKEIGIKEDGSIDENEYEKESTIDIMCYTDFMKFDESGYNYDTSGMGR